MSPKRVCTYTLRPLFQKADDRRLAPTLRCERETTLLVQGLEMLPQRDMMHPQLEGYLIEVGLRAPFLPALLEEH